MPSAEALSTTITSYGVCAAAAGSAPRQARISAAELNDTTMMASRGTSSVPRRREQHLQRALRRLAPRVAFEHEGRRLEDAGSRVAGSKSAASSAASTSAGSGDGTYTAAGP